MIRSFNTSLLRNPIFRKRSVEAKLLYFLLHNNADMHFTGLLRASVELMAVDMGVSVKSASAALGELADPKVRLVHVDLERDLVWLPEMVRMLGTKISPAQVQAADKHLGNFEACDLIAEVAAAMGAAPVQLLNSGQVGGSGGPSRGPSPPHPGDPPPDPPGDLVSGSGQDRVRTGSGLGQDQDRTGSEFILSIAGQASPAQPCLPKPDSPRTSAEVQGSRKPDRQTEIAIALLGELSAARKRVDPQCQELAPVAGNLEQIIGRMSDRPNPCTPDQIRHVIAVCEARARVDATAREYFDAVSPFRKRNIGRWLAMKLAQAERPPPDRYQQDRGAPLSDRHLQDARRSDAQARDPKHIDRLLDEMRHDHDDSAT